MNDFIKNKIKRKIKHSSYTESIISVVISLTPQNLSQDLSEIIGKRKKDYNRHLANYLTNPQSSTKTFWKNLKTFYNGNKVPLIPLITVNYKIVSDF